MTIDDIKLTEEQERARNIILTRMEAREPLTVLTGFAGTGKTTLLSVLLASRAIQRMRPVVAAPTGMAANVLRGMGVSNADTIHSAIYDTSEIDGKLYFARRDILRGNAFVADEGSMVTSNMLDDMMSFGAPLLIVGDGFQLPPIGDDPKILDRPHAILNEVHRQAKKSPIIRFATDIRNGKFKFGKDYGEPKKLSFGNYSDFLDAAGEYDQLVCGTNRTRTQINDAFRKSDKRRELIEPGEKIVCMKNNRKVGVYNGMFATVEGVQGIDKHHIRYTIRTDRNVVLPLIAYVKTMKTGKVERPSSDVYIPEATDWTYGYCVTGHKMQGSQAKRVAVYEDMEFDEMDRWRYTTATRAIDQLLYTR